MKKAFHTEASEEKGQRCRNRMKEPYSECTQKIASDWTKLCCENEATRESHHRGRQSRGHPGNVERAKGEEPLHRMRLEPVVKWLEHPVYLTRIRNTVYGDCHGEDCVYKHNAKGPRRTVLFHHINR